MYYEKRDLENYTSEEIEQDVQGVLNNINNPNKKSYLHLKRDERISMEFGAKYISTLNDIEFMQLLLDTQIIDTQQFKSLTRKYKDINLLEEVYVQENWKKITKAQEDSLEDQTR